MTTSQNLHGSACTVVDPPRHPPPQAMPARAHLRECMSFRRGAENYGIDIPRAQEIRGCEAPTRIANAPHLIESVLNLRGLIVPIVDLRIHFDLAEARLDTFTITGGGLVDAESGVLAPSAEEVRPVPGFGNAVPADQLMAIGVQGERTPARLHIDKLLASPALGLALSSALQ